MFDASAKIPSGILFSSYISIGNFDECYEYNDPSNGTIYGKYCLGTIKLNVEATRKELEPVNNDFTKYIIKPLKFPLFSIFIMLETLLFLGNCQALR